MWRYLRLLLCLSKYTLNYTAYIIDSLLKVNIFTYIFTIDICKNNSYLI